MEFIKKKISNDKLQEFMQGKSKMTTFYAGILQKNKILPKEELNFSEEFSEL